jgi:hypothetical protein
MFSKKTDKPTTRLRELSGSDYKIAKGQPDIRGWDVRDDAGRKYGVVKELIFDIRANKVRYMIINILDTRELELEKRTVMVPIGLAELDPSDNDVLLPAVTPFQLRALPRYDKSNLGAKAERDISTVFGRTGTTTPGTASQPESDVDETFYNHEHFNEDNMYRRRRGTVSDTNSKRDITDDAYQRRETEINTPVSSTNRNDTNPLYDDDETMRSGETEEDYRRRMRRKRGEL